MGYYLTGDYYQGDYYEGDPGLGRIVKSVVRSPLKLLKRVAGGVVKRTPIGIGMSVIPPVISMFQGAGPGRPGGGTLPAPRAGQFRIPLPGGIGISPQSILPGGKPFITRRGGLTRPGYHLDKKTGTREVRNRHMNPANPRALRRAVRREHGFIALAKRVLRGTGVTISRHHFARRTKARARR